MSFKKNILEEALKLWDIKKTKRSPQATGHDFEIAVQEIFTNNLYVPVARNQWITKNNQKREFDLVFFVPWKVNHLYIECKHHLDNKKSGLGEIEEFYEKIISHGDESYLRSIVTNTLFTNSSKKFGSQHDIDLVDGAALETMKKNPLFYLSGALRTYINSDQKSVLNSAFKMLNYSSLSKMIDVAKIYKD